MQWEDCKVVKYFENNLSGLYASLMLAHWGKGVDYEEYGWRVEVYEAFCISTCDRNEAKDGNRTMGEMLRF